MEPSSPESERRDKTLNSLLALAERELVASDKMFDSKDYHLAIYLLQQASEKSLKAFWIYTSLIDPNTQALTGLGHAPHGLVDSDFRKRAIELISRQKLAAEDFFRNEKAIAMLILPLLNRLFKEAEESIPKELSPVRNTRKDLNLIELDKLLEIKESVRSIEVGLDKAKIENPTVKDLTKWVSNDVDYAMDTGKASLRSWMFSMITSAILAPHEALTRYPSPEDGHDPIAYYTLSHPLVIRFNVISDMVKRSIKGLRYLTKVRAS